MALVQWRLVVAAAELLPCSLRPPRGLKLARTRPGGAGVSRPRRRPKLADQPAAREQEGQEERHEEGAHHDHTDTPHRVGRSCAASAAVLLLRHMLGEERGHDAEDCGDGEKGKSDDCSVPEPRRIPPAIADTVASRRLGAGLPHPGRKVTAHGLSFRDSTNSRVIAATPGSFQAVPCEHPTATLLLPDRGRHTRNRSTRAAPLEACCNRPVRPLSWLASAERGPGSSRGEAPSESG